MYGLHTRCRQQRLFTGALFPETLNDQIVAFACRHKLKSDVWVPRKAFDTALKPYNVYVLPKATLCDLTLTPGDGMGDVTAAIGVDRCLVNAEQTSNQHLLEGFVDFMMSCLTPPEQCPTRIQNQSFTPAAAAGTQVACRTATALPLSGREARRKNFSEYFSAANGGGAECTTSLLAEAADSSLSPVLLPDPTWDTLAPFQHPLALNGSLLTGTDTTAQLLKWQQESYRWSNYWRRLRGAKERRQSFYSVCDTEVPGRYNPHFCVYYVPHTYTNISFPLATAVLMRHRAVEHKYVSRLWLTLKQAEERFGTSLLPERANDEPVVYCNYFTAGMEATAFYCADQFAGGDKIFPTARELDIAAKGVRLPSTKLRAYPLLSRLLDQYDEGKTADSAGDDRPGTDQAVTDAGRHVEFFQHRQRCGAIRLHGFQKPEMEKNYLQSTRVAGALARQCLLCGYPRPLFFSHRALLAFHLRLREGEQGIVQTRLPTRVNKLLAWCKGECWFNVSQLHEPAVAQELMDNPPVHFLTRQSLQGAVAVNCCRAQLARRWDTAAAAVSSSSPTSSVPARCNFSAEWIPAYVLEMTGWQLREGAQGVPYVPLAAGAAFKRFPLGGNVLFSMADVSLHNAAKDWLRRYTPVDQEGYPFLRGVRQAMTLRAFERGYRAHQWLIHRVRKNGGFSSPLLALRGAFNPVCMSAPQPLLDTSAFVKAPFVRMGNFEFVNVEEVALMSRAYPCNGAAARESGSEEPDAPLLQMSSGARLQVESGTGTSAESLMRHSVRETDNTAALGDTVTCDGRDIREVDDYSEMEDEGWTSGGLSPLLYVQ